MIFQKNTPKSLPEDKDESILEDFKPMNPEEVDTVVGPSVNVEGDFASEGNIIVKGTVSGSVHTSRNLVVEPGAKIMANIRAGSAQIAGEVRGNIKVKESLELDATAKVMGDIEAQVLVLEAGALLHGKVVMPGLEAENRGNRSGRSSVRRTENTVEETAQEL